MSLSNNLDIPNPAKGRFWEWKSDLKTFRRWNKETGQQETMDLPFTFIVLDALQTIKGFSDEHNAGIWANEIRNTQTDLLTVRTKGGVLGHGLYQHVKGITGARYTRSLYIAYKENGELVTGNLQLIGGANGAWIEFTDKHKIYGIGITVTGAEAKKNKAITYNVPVFEITPATEETITKAIELDKELQVYLKAYLSRSGEITGEMPAHDEFAPDTSLEPPDDDFEVDGVPRF